MLRILKTSTLKAGLPPGTPIYTGEHTKEAVKITMIDYDKETAEVISPTSVEQCVPYKNKPSVTWINVDGLHQVDVIEKLCACFDLHPLTVEDILNTSQRPKLDVYDNYAFLVARMHTSRNDHEEFIMEQVSFIIGENFLITFQERSGDTFDAVRNRIRENKGRVRKMGPDYLLYALLDSVVDDYFSLLDNVGEEVEDLEEDLVTEPTPETQQRIHILKREMLLLRKSIWPLREVISGLQREEIPMISDSINYFLKDLYDHTIQVIDTVETFRDMITGMLDIYLSSISNRMNEIMKVLTIFAVIFIPLTFIAGVYGMNFNTAASPFNMPELNWYWGYPLALGLMVVVAVVMLFYFKRKNWL